ncbi:serine/threonine-protein kinase [Gordonia bronchialis]|uniref:serine/threonine-protein kinase n=1 Tax=Gordonia bronchialis TaxID=2054 RepID=UPI002270E8B9|nr:serine/threonine-protein kinase [Gordonia bronchialis]
MPELFDNRYEILEEIGSGGMGLILKAYDTQLDRVVALKVIREDLDDNSSRLRFIREAKIATELNHPNIVNVSALGITQDHRAYLVMDYVDGMDLRMAIHSGLTKNDFWKTRVLTDIASALHYAHSIGVVHRDIKPANILISSQDGKAQLADFGIALAVGSPRYTNAREVVASLQYASPEQLSAKALARTSDIYSLGVVAYELFSGRPPFSGDVKTSYHERINMEIVPLPRSVPEAARSLIMRALQPDPALRPQTAASFADGLKGLSDSGTKPMPPNATEPVSPSAVYETVGNSSRRVDPSDLLFASTPRSVAISAGRGLQNDETAWKVAFVVGPMILGAAAGAAFYMVIELAAAVLSSL